MASAGEQCSWEESAAEVRAAGDLGARPLIVLTAGRPFIPPDPVGAREATAFHETWVNDLQPRLARLSTRGRQVVVEESGHAIQYEAPEAVVNAVREVVTEVRDEGPH